MRAFILKVIGFGAIGILLLFSICEVALILPSAFQKIGFSKNWFVVYQIISASKDNIESDTLYLGDSIATQLFPPKQKKNYITTNAGTLMPGQYMIAANAIESNPDLKCIVLASIPAALGVRFEGFLTFNGFVKPFYTRQNEEYFTPELVAKINKSPYGRLYKTSLAKFLPFSDINYFDDVVIPVEEFRFSDVAIQYLKMLDELCKQKNIALHIVSSPLEKSFYTKTDNWKSLRKQLKEEQLDVLFEPYFNSIKYLDEEGFSDGLHIKQDLVPEIKTHLLNQIRL